MPATSQLPLGQNNPYAKVAYFTVVYYNPLNFLRGNQSSSALVKILVPKLLCFAVSSLRCLKKKNSIVKFGKCLVKQLSMIFFSLAVLRIFN